MVSIVAGIVTVVSPMQPEKTPFPNDETEDGIAIDNRLLHSKKA